MILCCNCANRAKIFPGNFTTSRWKNTPDRLSARGSRTGRTCTSPWRVSCTESSTFTTTETTTLRWVNLASNTCVFCSLSFLYNKQQTLLLLFESFCSNHSWHQPSPVFLFSRCPTGSVGLLNKLLRNSLSQSRLEKIWILPGKNKFTR